MKAVVAYENRAIMVQDREIPKLRDDCVLVKVSTIALNPTDWKHLYRNLVTDGCLLGCDFSGVVVDIGKNVTKKWSKGDRIAGTTHGGNTVQPGDGAFAEYIVAKGDLCLKVPPGLSFAKAVTLPLGIATVMQGLYQKGLLLNWPDRPVREKTYVLIYGGSTATGALGIQFAKRSGYTVISTCSKRNFEYVKALGADIVLDYREADVGMQIRNLTQNQLKLAWDVIASAESTAICSEALSSESGCRYASFLANKSPRADVVSVGTNMYTIWGDYFIVGTLEYPASVEDFEYTRKFMPLAEELIERGEIKPHNEVVKEGGLEGAITGLKELSLGHVSSGKLVYRLNETP